MSRVRLLSGEEAPIPARPWYREDGSASALTRSLASAPDVMETLMPFLGQIMGESSLDLATKELVVLRVSHLNGCRYCLASHRPLALSAGVASEQVAALCDEASLGALPERERALVEWVDRVTLDAAGVTDELVASTLDYLRDDQLIELTLLAGATTMLNQYCTALGIPPPR
jgi:AhpD family alkylhydroperoxidase